MREWDEIWQNEEGRVWWLEPAAWVVSLVPRFKGESVETVLDLGFGLGRHCIFLAKEGFQVCGVDVSPAGLEFALEWAAREGVAVGLSVGEMGQLPYRSDAFDLILAWNVIYHGTVEYIRTTIAEIRRCLRPGGIYSAR